MPAPKIDPRLTKMFGDFFKSIVDAAADAALEEVQNRLKEGYEEVDGRLRRTRSKVSKKQSSSANGRVIDAEIIDD